MEDTYTHVDEDLQNDIYLEGSVEDFDQFIAEGNFQGAQSVINDLNENGFTVAADRLSVELANKKLHD